MTLTQPSQRALGLLLLAVGLLYLFTIREGHVWTGDFAQYLQHADHLAGGEPYALSGVAVSRHIVPAPYPAAYPPVFPILLVPLQIFFGHNLEILKLINLIFFIPALYLMARLFSRRLEPASLLAVLVLVALNPLCWQMKDAVLSDIPFIFFTYAALLAVRRSAEAASGSTWSRYGFLVAGLLAYLSFATRTAGVVVLPAAILLDLLRTRRISAPTFKAGLIALPVALVQFFTLPGGAGYLSWIGEADWRVYFFSLLLRLRNYVDLWGAASPSRLCMVVAALAGVALLYLSLRRLIKGPDLIDIFFILYLLVLLVYPGGSPRYLVPIFPILLLYLFEGIDRLYTRKRLRTTARAALILALLLSYGTSYVRLDLRTIPHGVTGPEAMAFFEHIRANTAEDDVVISIRPRIVHLYTGRISGPYYRPFEDWFRRWEMARGRRQGADQDAASADQLWRLEVLREVSADYLLQIAFFDYDRVLLTDLVDRHPELFSLVHQTEHFKLFRIGWED